MNPRRYLFVVNPEAGFGRAARLLASALERFPVLRETSRTITVRSVDDVVSHLSSAAGGTIVPVAAGGDGTVNLVVRALFSRRSELRVLGVLPLGTGNLLANFVGARSLDRGLQILERGREQPTDVFHTSHPDMPLALMSISVGVESRFIDCLARLRRPSHARGLALASMRSVRGSVAGCELTVDGEPLVTGDPVYNLGLYNTKCYAFGWVVLPDADPADGEGEAVVHKTARTYWRALFRGLRIDERRTGQLAPRYRRWRRATITSTQPIQVDGEVVAGASFEVWVERRAVHVMADPGALWCTDRYGE
ncbi:MAG: diacylglycerol kinase family protein [Gemmatimonadetes bacterium]|nr:diacylglycerol kinase family protein [Gemmatimonadota bacterium]